ncbi:hypothetical protein L9F63_027001, partial [Diploptera punctata]
MQHFGLQGTQRLKMRRKSEEFRTGMDKENIPTKSSPKTPEKAKSLSETVDRMALAGLDVLDVKSTPERIEFENLTAAASDVEEAPSEMDEDEWTDRNFGASAAEASSDSLSDLSDSEEEANENGEDKESDEDLSCPEYESEDDESETATEGEDDIRARELRKQEVQLEVPERLKGRRNSDTGSDTEVASDDYSSTESESEEEEGEEEEEENSATEIETDSEFEHDGTTPTQHEVPSILIDDSNITFRRGRRVAEEPKKVQVRTGHIKQVHGGVKLEFSPLQPEAESAKMSTTANNNANNNASKIPPIVKPTPLINPRRGDYLLNRTHSTEGIASKMSLELKKKYLLGASGLAGSVKKSGSASTLDSKFKSFVDMISEHQKLLNPAPEPSPTMQAFLQGTSKLHVSPPALLRKQKELPLIGDGFEHVCGLGKKEAADIVTKEKSNKETTEIIGENVELSNNIITEIEKKDELVDINEHPMEESDYRPRSPVHETSIVVPEIPWKATQSTANDVEDDDDNDDIASDSLSSDSASGLDDDNDDESDHKSKESSLVHERTPPRVEIHDSSGELMLEPAVEERSKTDEIVRPNKIILPEPIVISSVETNSEDKKVEETPNSENKRFSMTSDRSSPSTPPSTRGEDSESFQNEATLAETELSDWAQDADVVVSEDLEDVEFNIDPDYVTVRRHRKPKTIRKSTSGSTSSARIARSEDFDFDDDPGHVCGIKNKQNEQDSIKDIPSNTSHLLSNIDNIEFMDSGEEETESDDVLAATNKALLQNSGYVQFVNITDDDEMSTPIVETPTIASAGEDEENSLQPEGTTTEETTTSEIVTVKDGPADISKADKTEEADVFFTPQTESKESAYEEYVRRLQGRISPFSNVRDSIDIRKSRQIQESVSSTSAPGTNFNSPSTSRKLEAISRERSKQKDLIHEMVMDKVMMQKKSPQDRKSKRLSRGSLTSYTQVHTCPPAPEAAKAGSPEKVPDEETTDSGVDEKRLSVHQDLERPLSVHSPIKVSDYVGVSEKNTSHLPDTPLTNPEAFSLPDIRRALFENSNETFKTPVAPPRTKHEEAKRTAERERAREEARIKAQLKTDEELGLSPEDYIKMLRQKVPKRHGSDSVSSAKRHGIHRSLSEPGETSECASSSTQLQTSPIKKSQKICERRKSIIQAVSDFFHKKKDSSRSPSPSKTAVTSSQTPKEKFPRLRFNKQKDKGKDKVPLVDPRSRSVGDSNSRVLGFIASDDTRPPPIPPPPVNYHGSGSGHRISEDSCSEPEEDSRATALSTPTHETYSSVDGAASSLNRKHSRVNRRIARQAQLKRLRMAQEIQRQLEELEVKQRELERRGVSVEKSLRGEGRHLLEKTDGKEESELLREWFDLMRERTELRRYERELMVRAQEMELEDRHARLQQELRDRMSND